MLNREKFKELFGCYKPEVQELIMRQLYDPKKDFVFGLDRLEAKALRDYLEVEVKLDCPVVVRDPKYIPPMAKVSRKLMSGVMSQKYLLDIDAAAKELSGMMDVSDLKQLNIVSKHTTGELMEMYGIASYPLLQLAKKNNIYPLPDLAPNGAIRPFIDITDANFSEHLSNALVRTSRMFGRRYSNGFGNISSLLAMDDDEILKIRNVGKVRLEEISKIRNIAKICYPEYYKRLMEFKDYARDGEYFKPGSKEDFDEFKKECELRKLINFDDSECLIKIEEYTASELRSMFGELYDVLESKCKVAHIYPLPETDGYGNVFPKYEITRIPTLASYYFDKAAKDIKYVHQLFELNDEEMEEWLSGLKMVSREDATAFVERVHDRYSNHVARLKEIRSKRCNQKRIDG